MKYYGYIRVSTATQAEKGYGLETQRELIQQYAAANGIQLENIYVDAGISANIKVKAGMDTEDEISKRRAFVKMLTVLEKGDVIIIANTSRLWRSVVTQGIVTSQLAHIGANVKSIEQPNFDLYDANEDPDVFFMNAVTGVLDTVDRMRISVKLTRGRATKAAGGDKPAGKAPYGYKWTDRTDRRHIELDPDEAPTVKQIFSLAQKGYSLQRIADTLNAQGSAPRQTRRSANEWSRQAIHVILRNDFYVGTLHYADSTIQGNHPAIISKVQFGKVAAQLARKDRRKGNSPESEPARTAS